MERVVVVGGGHAGVQCAASLREAGFTGAISLVTEEDHLPYQRPPLSKDHLGGAATPLPLRGQVFYDDNAVELLSGATATAIDRERQEVVLGDGRRLPYSTVVLATGAQARRLPGVDDADPGVHQIRTLADAERLRGALATAERAVVVGAGFLGLEFAAVAQARGVDVTLLEGGPRVLGRSVSPEMAAHVATAHEAAGIRLLLGEGLAAVRSRGGRVEAVLGTSGALHPADLVLLAVGARPRDDLAREAGLEVADGVLVDAHLRTSDPQILAIGDCARLSSPAAGTPGRLESVQNAVDQARHAAQVVVLGAADPYTAVPWFWSNQGPLRLQIAGVRGVEDTTTTVGDVAPGAFSVLSFGDDRRLTCVESLNRPADHLAARRLLGAGRLPTVDEVTAAGFSLKAFARDLTTSRP